MSVTAIVRYGQFYGPNVELRRTIASKLGGNAIDVTDEFFSPGNTEVPHAWLLHINFGYPLVDDGAELCFDASRIEPLDNQPARARFGDLKKAKKIPAPLWRTSRRLFMRASLRSSPRLPAPRANPPSSPSCGKSGPRWAGRRQAWGPWV